LLILRVKQILNALSAEFTDLSLQITPHKEDGKKEDFGMSLNEPAFASDAEVFLVGFIVFVVKKEQGLRDVAGS